MLNQVEELEKQLNDVGNANIESEKLMEIGVKLLAATTPISSFIGNYNHIRVYAVYDYSNHKWHVERD